MAHTNKQLGQKLLEGSQEKGNIKGGFRTKGEGL